MKIKLEDLKKFKVNSVGIKSNSILPILNYLKFENGTLMKNNLKAFVTQTIPGVDQDFLIDDRILMNFIEFSSSEEIDINIEGARVIISDKFTKVISPTDDIKIFPTTDIPEGETQLMTEKLLKAIGVAQNFIVESDNATAKIHVFVGNNYVAASDGFIAYLEKIEGVPKIFLRKHTCQALANFTEAKFIENDSYHFFETEGCKFGFVKPEGTFFDLTPFAKIPTDSEKFTVNKTEFVRFTDMCTTSTESKIFVGTMKVEDNKLKLDMNDKDFEVDVKKEIECIGAITGEFRFNVSYMGKVLKTLPDEELTFHKSNRKCYITGASGFVALIMELI